MSLKLILQAKLKQKGYLSVNDVMQIAQDLGHYYDTARRKLEPTDTPFAKKVKGDNGNIKGWRLADTPVSAPQRPQEARSEELPQEKKLLQPNLFLNNQQAVTKNKYYNY